MDFKCSFSMIDCVLSAFSFKIRLVLISASAIVNHDATPSLTPSFIPARVFGFRVQFPRLTDSFFLFSERF